MGQGVFERHPRLTLFLVILTLLIFLGVLAEITLRFTTPYDIGYYTAVRKEGVYHYPYGDLVINKDNYFDKDFDTSSPKPRIGYMGDSIIMGVGAGDGYRIGDLLEKRYPAYEHWTFGVMGNGLREDLMFSLIEKYRLDKIVYGLNLNDFLPPIDKNGQPIAGPEQSVLEKTVQKLYYAAYVHFDWLRGKSYLYTVARTGVKNILQSMGIGHTGFKSVELYPKQNEDIIRDIALRFNETAKKLEQNGVGFCLIIFPYEMQISPQAAKTYAHLGIHWEDGFESGSTQTLFLKYLDVGHVYDARHAFDGVPNGPAGTYFVYNKGDKIDFNHLNRAGHAVVTDGLTSSKTCDF